MKNQNLLPKLIVIILLLAILASVFSVCIIVLKKDYSVSDVTITPEYIKQQIDEISEVGLDNELEIELIYANYCALSDQDKQKVTNYPTLCEYRKQLARLLNTQTKSYSRFDLSKINIGTCCFYFTDEEHIKELYDAGISFTVFSTFDNNTLDIMAKYNIGAITSVPSNLEDHKALYGIYIADEPGATQFINIEHQRQYVEENYPGLIPYVNLFPLLKFEPRLETNYSYDDYLRLYSERMNFDYICYDRYLYEDGTRNNLREDVENYILVAEKCKQENKDFWMVIQLNSADASEGDNPTILSENQLRLQANLSLAFGSEFIIWACWQDGWWAYNVYEDGERTEQYEKMTNVNKEINELSPVYMRYKYNDYALSTFSFNSKFDDIKLDYVDTLNDVIFTMFDKKDNSDGKAMMIVNATEPLNAPNDTNKKLIKFKVDDKYNTVIAYRNGKAEVLTPTIGGKYQVYVENSDEVFITIS